MIDNYPNSLTELHDCLVEAAETERRLPAALRKQKLASWVDIQPEWLAYADTNKHNTLVIFELKIFYFYSKIIF